MNAVEFQAVSKSYSIYDAPAESWIDSYENAAMILSGMGPLASPSTYAGKVFAGTYALFSGIADLAIAAVIAAPLVHRFLHRLHADPGASR